MMLVLSRKLHERITIGNNVVISVERIEGGKVRIGIQAPDDLVISRDELLPPGDPRRRPGLDGDKTVDNNRKPR
jgi:carbon storage regulator